MRIETYQCEVCGKQRASDTNHWYVATVGDHQLIIEPWSHATPEAIKQATFHLCGQEHLMQKVAEWAAQL